MVFFTAEPKDTCHDWVSTWGIRADDLTGALATFEYRSGGSSATDFFSNLELAEGRAVCSRATPEAELGSRYRISLHGLAVSNEKHFLISNTDDHFIAIIIF